LAFYYVKACWPLALGTLQYALAAPLFLAVAGYFNRRAVDEISVLMALEGLMMVTGSALASATCTHTAILYSGRKVAQLLAFSQFVQVFVFAFSFVMAAFVLVALSIYVYMLDGALIKMELFVIWMCAFPLRTYNTVVILGLFRGFGSIRGPFILDFVSVWFFALPCLLILAYFDVEEVAVIYAVFLLDETKAIVLYVLLRRFIRRLGAPDKVIYP
jgi:Na+-driven multidrug efflux pump